jgi:GMP synthase-like glutamine amidotransferase
MQINVHYFQHVPFEGLGAIEGWATRSGHRLSCTRFCDGDPLPALEEVDWLVIMGGPMSVRDERAYPWLGREKRFIESAIRAGRVVLGVCLGAQLVADVLGAKVYANRFKEIGWFPIQRTAEAATTPIGSALPHEIEVFHWHGDTFDLPVDAVRLARSEGCDNQGFLYRDRVVGLQFHLEVTKAGVKQLVARCAADLTDGPFVQQPELMLGDESRFSKVNDVLVRLLDQLARIAVDRA